MWPEPGSNRRPFTFQANALPTELSGHHVSPGNPGFTHGRYFTCRLRKNASSPTPCTYNTYKAAQGDAQGDAQTTGSGYSTGISRRRVELEINPIRGFPHARFHIKVPLNDVLSENIARRPRSNWVAPIQNNDVITKLRG